MTSSPQQPDARSKPTCSAGTCGRAMLRAPVFKATAGPGLWPRWLALYREAALVSSERETRQRGGRVLGSGVARSGRAETCGLRRQTMMRLTEGTVLVQDGEPRASQ